MSPGVWHTPSQPILKASQSLTAPKNYSTPYKACPKTFIWHLQSLTLPCIKETGLKDHQIYISEVHRLHNSLHILVTEHLPIPEEDLLTTHNLEAAQLYCLLSERILGHVVLHAATIQVCRFARCLEFTNDVERRLCLDSTNAMEVNAAKGAVRALRIFQEGASKLVLRMQGLDISKMSQPQTVIQEHPSLLFPVSKTCCTSNDPHGEL